MTYYGPNNKLVKQRSPLTAQGNGYKASMPAQSPLHGQSQVFVGQSAQRAMPHKPDLIQLRQVIKTYTSDAGTFTVLKGIDLRIAAGEFVAIVGKSGSGKSTLINMITGIDHPTSGQVIIGGTEIHALSENQMAIWRGRRIGLVFQFFQLLPALTVLQNVTLPMDFCGVIPAGIRKQRALYLLNQVDMVEHAHKLPTALSGGQQQRVAIARALANDPPMIVADEPTGNLDSRTAGAVFQLFRELVAQGKTIIMVTHDDDIAKNVTRALTVIDGKIVRDTNSLVSQKEIRGATTLFDS